MTLRLIFEILLLYDVVETNFDIDEFFWDFQHSLTRLSRGNRWRVVAPSMKDRRPAESVSSTPF